MISRRALALALFLGAAVHDSTSRAGADGGAEPSGKAAPPRDQATGSDPRAWRKAYDWDGDGVKDEVVSTFSGGGHCCYRVGIKFASPDRTIMLPFNLDGGYAYPEDLPSNPERFTIDASGKTPAMVLEIETYNDEPKPLDPAWKAKYGVRSHRIAVTFAGRKVRVRNLPSSGRSGAGK